VFEPCDCGSGGPYGTCCGKLHAGAPAGSAEALMRSRYSAYCRGKVAYLLKTWAPESRPLTLVLDEGRQWTGLTVRRHEMTGPDTASVQFEATFRRGAKTGRLIETGRFRRDGAGWVYIDGVAG